MGHAVNAAGVVAGTAGVPNSSRGFVWQNGVMTDLGVLASNSTSNHSSAASLNDAGQVVGTSSTEVFATNRAFVWQNGVMQNLGVLPGGSQSAAADINGNGHVVGFSFVPGTFFQVPHAFLWTSAGGMIDLGTLGGSTSQARSINDSGTVIGMSTTAANLTRPFVYRNGAMTDLTTLLPAGHCYANIDVFAVNNDGTIVGSAQVSGQSHRAVLLVPGSTSTGTTNCGTTPPPPPPPPTEIVAQMRAIVANIDNAGVSTSMDVKLRNVLNSMGDTDKATACNHLAAFANELDAQDGRHITAADSAALRLRAAQLAGMLRCG